MRAKRSGPIVGALAGLGQRSLSGYLFQSLAWLLLLLPFTLDLAGRFGSPAVTGLVTAVSAWLVSVLLARRLHDRGQPGPAETVLRRLTYGSRR